MKDNRIFVKEMQSGAHIETLSCHYDKTISSNVFSFSLDLFIFFLIIFGIHLFPLPFLQSFVLPISLMSSANAYSANEGKLVADVEKGMMFLSLDGDGNLDELASKNKKYDFMPVEPGASTMQTLKARLKGSITDNLKIDWDYDSTSWPSNRKFQLGYEKKNTKLKLGDLSMGFSGLDFSMSHRTLFGFQANHDTRDDRFVFCAAKLKTSFESENLYGDDTIGPFFLSNYPVEQMSERILVDDEIRIQNIHYTIDYKTGVVKFNDPVEKGSRIRIDYEHTDLFDTINSYVGAARYRKMVSSKFLASQSSVGTFIAFQNQEKGIEDTFEDGMVQSMDQEISTNDKDMVIGFDFKTGYGKFKVSGEVAISNDTNDYELSSDDASESGNSSVSGLSKIVDDTIGYDEDNSMSDMTGRAVKLNASYSNKGFSTKAVMKHINKDFGIVGSPDFDNNRNYYKFDTAYAGIKDIKLNGSYTSEKRNIEKVLDESPEKNEAKAGISYKMPFSGSPLVSYNVKALDQRIETSLNTSYSVNPNYKISEKDELTHSLDMKYRIKKVLFKTGIDYKQNRYTEALNDIEQTSSVSNLFQESLQSINSLFDLTEDSDDLQARFEIKARIAKPVVGTFKMNLTDHDGLAGATGKTKEGIIDLDTKISNNITLTTGLRIKESDFIINSRDYARSLRLIGKKGKNFTARLSYEGREQKGSSNTVSGSQETTKNETTVLSGDLEYCFRPGISIKGELVERSEKTETSADKTSETEAGLVLNYKINKNFDLSAHVKKMIQSGMDSSDYDGTIRYFKATGRF